MSAKQLLPVAGSARALMSGAQEVGRFDGTARIDVTVRLRPKSAGLTLDLRRRWRDREYLERSEFEQRFGAAADDLRRVEAFAAANGLAVKESSAARRTVVLNGPVRAFQTAFGVELKQVEHASGKYRGRTGEIYVPQELHGIVQGVFGLDNRPQAKTHFRRPSAAVTQTYTPLQVASLYQYPTSADGAGECIGLIELGGGYKASDLSAYWKQLNLAVTPDVVAVSVGGADNTPTGDPNGPDAEVALDIEIAGAIAPGAKIAVYFAENTDAGFLNAITTAIHDTANKPSVISISWGGPESSWTAQAMTSMDNALQSAAALGVTVCVACGDDGSTDGVSDGQSHVDFPASSPHVLACGGTRIATTSNAISSETVWNDLASNEGATGGGISDVFALPSWQGNAGVPPSANANRHVGRGLPDVAGDADPTTGYNILVDGQSGAVGGTSAVAPLWAALLALLNQSLGKPVGFLNPELYQFSDASGDFRDITSGNNGAYSAGPGWDACSGLGSPHGTQLLASLNG